MKGGKGRTALPGLQIHEHQIGDDVHPIGEMRKVQARFLASASRPGHRHYRQRGEDAVGGIQLHRHSGEHPRRGASAPTPRNRMCRQG